MRKHFWSNRKNTERRLIHRSHHKYSMVQCKAYVCIDSIRVLLYRTMRKSNEKKEEEKCRKTRHLEQSCQICVCGFFFFVYFFFFSFRFAQSPCSASVVCVQYNVMIWQRDTTTVAATAAAHDCGYAIWFYGCVRRARESPHRISYD